MNHNPFPTKAAQDAAWAAFIRCASDASATLTRNQVAALLGVTPATVLLYETAGKLKRLNGPGERPAMICTKDFSDALRLLVTRGLLSRAAAEARATKHGPAPKTKR